MRCSRSALSVLIASHTIESREGLNSCHHTGTRKRPVRLSLFRLKAAKNRLIDRVERFRSSDFDSCSRDLQATRRLVDFISMHLCVRDVPGLNDQTASESVSQSISFFFYKVFLKNALSRSFLKGSPYKGKKRKNVRRSLKNARLPFPW